MTSLRAIEVLLAAHRLIGSLVVQDARKPFCLLSPERHVVARIFNELEDDLEILAENWEIVAPWSKVRMIDADDELDFMNNLIEPFDSILEDQEMADFAQDRDEDNFDHSEML